eukprot:2794329-Rhodomonas_salina.4
MAENRQRKRKRCAQRHTGRKRSITLEGNGVRRIKAQQTTRCSQQTTRCSQHTTWCAQQTTRCSQHHRRTLVLESIESVCFLLAAFFFQHPSVLHSSCLCAPRRGVRILLVLGRGEAERAWREKEGQMLEGGRVARERAETKKEGREGEGREKKRVDGGKTGRKSKRALTADPLCRATTLTGCGEGLWYNSAVYNR